MTLVQLFLAFFRVGLCSIGGAYSFLPVLERELVDNCKWLSRDEYLDVLGMTNVFPGAISIKYATYAGYKVAGILGVIVANLGNITAPALFVIFAFTMYKKYKDVQAVKGAFNMIQLVLFALIIAVAFCLIDVNKLVHLRNLAVVIVSFLLFLYTKIHPAFIIIGAGILGAILK